jgi:hypothetical protein
MSIDYTGHSAFTIEETQARITHLRKARPDWFFDSMKLTDAHGLGRFGLEIAQSFGIEARCCFSLFLLNNDWVAECEPAVEFIYEVFGTAKLVMTYGMDSIRQPGQPYPGTKVDPLI